MSALMSAHFRCWVTNPFHSSGAFAATISASAISLNAHQHPIGTIGVVPTLVSLVTSALEAYSLSDVEDALVAEYCAQNHLIPEGNTSLGRALARNDLAPLRTHLLQANSWSLDDLIISFETCVPRDEAKRYGAVFTPDAITSFMAAEAIQRAVDSGVAVDEITVIDPAVGCGALLVAALRALVARGTKSPSEVSKRLTGIDISASSASRAELLISIACLALADPLPAKPNIIVGNSLEDDIADLALDTRGYSLVLANPA